jgi:hypothetical protein
VKLEHACLEHRAALRLRVAPRRVCRFASRRGGSGVSRRAAAGLALRLAHRAAAGLTRDALGLRRFASA